MESMEFVEASQLSSTGHSIYHISKDVYRHFPNDCPECIKNRACAHVAQREKEEAVK